MCCGTKRCVYCEDSMADEVEHFRPKNLYPELVFDWSNYVYSCGPCNGSKLGRFALHLTSNGRCYNATRRRNAAVLQPPSGTALLINPRVEEPLEFLFLDIAGTFRILPMLGLGPIEQQRARYTIQILRLNARDALLDARKNAFRNYVARLRDYISRRDRGEDISNFLTEFSAMDHRSVWLEIKRQRANYPALEGLFIEAPESLNW